MFCRKCGKEINYDSEFCTVCTEKLAFEAELEADISSRMECEQSDAGRASADTSAKGSTGASTDGRAKARAALIKGIISSAAAFSGLLFATAIVQLSLVMTNLGVILFLNSFALVIGGLILGISAISNYRRSPDEDRSIVSLILGIVGICFSAMALFYMFFIFIVVYITLFAFGGGFWWL